MMKLRDSDFEIVCAPPWSSSGIEIVWPPPKPSVRPYDVLLADCPWEARDKLPGKSRGASKNYETQQLEYLKKFRLPLLGDDAVMFFWRLSSMQPEALDVVRSWGFTVTSEIVWQKLTKHGKKWFGMGRTVRASHETCLICTRGRYRRIWRNKSIRSVFRAPVPLYPEWHEKAGKYWHSAKPPELYEIIKDACPRARCIELFARLPREGWWQRGDELELARKLMRAA
jgi:N6-adenosine-specific RNA methylase IME4